MRTITLEEHYATEAFMEGPGRELKAQAEAARSHPQVAAGYEKLIEQLCDLGDGRISAMDAAGIDVQVLSLTFPGVEQLEAAEAVAVADRKSTRLNSSHLLISYSVFFFNDTATTEIYTLSLHDALPISPRVSMCRCCR